MRSRVGRVRSRVVWCAAEGRNALTRRLHRGRLSARGVDKVLRSSAIGSPARVLLGPLVQADDVRAAWEALSTDRQRVVIDALMKAPR